MSQGDAVTSSIHTYWYQTNLTAYAVKTLELRKKKSFNISYFKNNPNKDL